MSSTPPPTIDDSIFAPGTSAMDRRSVLKLSGLMIGGLSMSSLLAACGAGGASTSGSDSLTLKMPFLQDMQVPDPDIMYEGEGVQVMRACYEGLINYKPGTSDFVPHLATSWDVSTDGLTYTFHLAPNVTFHDGTPADATSWIKSFDRRLKVNQGPAYMVEGIAKSEAPDANTLVITLKAPNNAFLHYAACPWQMYVTSPTAVTKNAKGSDLAQGWLKTHDAGTGPYVMKEFVPGSHYTLERYDDYWNGTPYFKTIQIAITPEISNQKLQLDSGAFDIVTKGFAIPDVLSYKKNDKFTVDTEFGGSVLALYMNCTSGTFGDQALRKAMMTALDRKTLVDTAFKGMTKVAEDFWPPDMFPTGLSPFSTEVDIAPLKAAVAKLPSKKIDLGWVTSYGAPAQQLAELIQTQLASTGLEITVRAIPSAEEFDLCNQAPTKRPDLMVAGMGGDALHLDTALRIFLRTGAKPLNFFQYSNPQMDKAMDDAITKLSVDEMNAAYQAITNTIIDEALFIPFCQTPFNLIMKKAITGLWLDSYYPEIFDPAKIKST